MWKIVVLTCAYKRTEIFKKFVDNVPYKLVVVGDEQNQQELKNGVYLLHENKPLGKKWNYGLQFCKNMDFDYLVITGSDDLFCPNLWQWYQTINVHYAGLLDLYFIDGLRVKYCAGFNKNRYGEPHGAGRVLHRSVLEELDWTLWDDNINIGLDASMTTRLQRLDMQTQFIKIKDMGFVAADIKTSENLHSHKEYSGVWCDQEERRYVFKRLNL